MRLYFIEVVLLCLVFTYRIAKISSFGTFLGGGDKRMGGWGELKIQLISAKAEVEAWLSLAIHKNGRHFSREKKGRFLADTTLICGYQ